MKKRKIPYLEYRFIAYNLFTYIKTVWNNTIVLNAIFSILLLKYYEYSKNRKIAHLTKKQNEKTQNSMPHNYHDYNV